MYDEATLDILAGNNFATLSTVGPDGGPQSSIVWFLFDGQHVLLSVIDSRRKARNIALDPRVSVAIFDLNNPYRSVELRGTAALLPDPDKELGRRLSQKYLRQDPPPEPADVRRLIVQVSPTKVNVFAP
jgi:PPOX class probable F420-dependent enzyme